MPAFHIHRLGSLALMAAGLGLVGCGSVTERTRSALYAVTPYKVEVVQGNFISKEQVALLAPGMSRQQVREILGTSLLSDVFHQDRWDYVFTIRRQGVEPQRRHFTVFFKGESVDRFSGDEMPSEEEFVATLDNKRVTGKVPQLTLSPEELRKLDAPAKKAEAAEPSAQAPLPASYPPLESAR